MIWNLESDNLFTVPHRTPLIPEAAANRSRTGLRPRPQLDRAAEGHVPTPPGGEPPRVLRQQGRGVDAVALKRPAAEMVDEDIPGRWTSGVKRGNCANWHGAAKTTP